MICSAMVLLTDRELFNVCVGKVFVGLRVVDDVVNRVEDVDRQEVLFTVGFWVVVTVEVVDRGLGVVLLTHQTVELF